MRKPTPQQEAVYDAVAAGSSHVTVQAVAGAGKSTTAVEASHRSAAARVGFVAFNRHIAADLQPKLGTRASACTLHSLGFTAVLRAFPGVEVEEGKAKRLLQGLRPKWFFEGRNGKPFARDPAQACLQLARLCKLTLTRETERELVSNLAEYHGIDLTEEEDGVLAAVPELIGACLEETDVVDFDDQIWFPVRRMLAVGSFDLLFVDEAQDLSRCQQVLARGAGERLCVIGDTAQAIYGFSGSDCDALPRMVEDLGRETAGCVERPLTVTFRCPVAHVELARRVVPDIEPSPWAAPGVVSQVSPENIWVELMAGDLAICRCNGPLVDLAYRLLSASVPVTMCGRDIGKGLLDLVGRLKADDPKDLARKLIVWERREQAKLDRRDAPESEYQSLADRVLCLDTLATHSDSLDALRRTILDLFSDDAGRGEGKVVLSSIHRAKGLEADRVVIVAPEKLTLVRRDNKPWQVTQELNLAYIAVTRARQELIFAGSVPALFSGRPVGLSPSLFTGGVS